MTDYFCIRPNLFEQSVKLLLVSISVMIDRVLLLILDWLFLGRDK